MTKDPSRTAPRYLTVSAILLGALCASVAFLPTLAADAPTTGAPPNLNLSAPGVAWAGFVAPKASNYAIARLFNDYANPETGLGPVTDGPAHPYVNNEVAREMRIPPTYRVADLNNAAGKNLMPWLERSAEQTERAQSLQGRNGETREARCWETGVPAFHLNPGLMHIIQTPKEVVLFLVGRTRHIWLNTPHTSNPKPSWYGESVGHYEGDTLVVDTIGFNDKTFVDSYRTPHTDKLHVVERGPTDRWRQYARSTLHGRRPRRLLSALVGVAESSPGGESGQQAGGIRLCRSQ